MERSTVAIYDDRGEKWAESASDPERKDDAEEFGAEVRSGSIRLDVGCGAGRYTPFLGGPCIGLDASRKMLGLARAAAPEAVLVQADMEALPFAHKSAFGAWANMSYLHVPKKDLPAALADLQRSLQVGSPFDIQVLEGQYEGNVLPQDRLGGRFFASWESDHLIDVLKGAGFDVDSTEVLLQPRGDSFLQARTHRARTLPDTVGPEMSLLVCGLNPSVYSADAGIGFARPGNRFWPAALASGLVTKDRDTRRALSIDRVGMTDLIKRATPNASELSRDEYRGGASRVERLVEWLKPGAVCFVGLAGWRAAIDPKAVAGIQDKTFGGRPAYVMPSTSGLNANSRLEDLTEHLREAKRLASRT
jgi:TDG/mug DNA glycosylase family protein